MEPSRFKHVNFLEARSKALGFVSALGTFLATRTLQVTGLMLSSVSVERTVFPHSCAG